MAVGRISGPLLKQNLIRNGIDLAFETDLLYLDVNNQRIGVKTTTPQHELDVNGTTRTTNLTVDTEADIADINIIGNTISTTNPYLNLGTLDTVVYQNRARIDSIDIEGNTISTNNSNANLELKPNGTGTVEVLSDMNVDGNIHATGNISADGDITIGDTGDDSTQLVDTVTFNAGIASDVVPDDNNTYTLGTSTRKWADTFVQNLDTTSLTTTTIEADGINLILRQGNIYYVAENGDDANTGTHQQDPFASIKHALSQATSGDTVHIYPGRYTEEFPLTVPVGVTVKGTSLRSTTVQPTTETRYNDAFLLNGESTVEDIMITGFYSGGNFFEVTDAGASPVWPQQSKLTASDAASGDNFGRSVAIDGDTAIVGAYRDDDIENGSGSAYIFTRSGGSWTQQQKLTAGDPGNDDRFGWSVAIDGDTAIIGAYRDDDPFSSTGSAYVFTRSGSTWTQQQKLTASDASTGDIFGWSVAIDGDTAIIGTPENDDDGTSSGSAYVFTRSGSTWTEQQKLTASDAQPFDDFGQDVAISGDTVVVGADGEFSSAGAAYVFTRSGSTWTEQQKLTNAAKSLSDFFGRSVSIDGDTIIIGTYQDDDNSASNSGSATVFTRSGGTWTEQQKLTASDPQQNDYFGFDVAINGDTVVVGAYLDDDNGASSGSAYVFTRTGSTWTEQEKITASDGASIDLFGITVAVSGEYVISGAYGDDDDGASSGSAYIFNKPGGTSNTTVNVGTTDQAHNYDSGGTITIDDIEYPITGADYDESTGVLEVYHTGGLSTVGDDVFLSGLTFSCNSDTRTFPDNGYAFRFATDFEVTTRSPYIKNITVITAGSSVAAGTNSADDPRGFNDGDAGKGAYIDGAYATAASKEASMLFHSATFMTPNVDAITCTNGVRVEWLNSFSYFANRGFFCYDSNAGLAYDGKTRVRLSGVTGTFQAGDTVTFTSADASTVITATVDSIDAADSNVILISGKNTDLLDFDTTPQSISASPSGASATTIENVDVRKFGAEVRMIGSASVYGNYGLWGDGDGVIIYAIGQNLAYIGNGKEVTNDQETVVQENEIIELNNAKVRYNSVDHKGDFRVGDLFYVNQDDGTVNFAASALNFDLTSGATFNTDGNITFINGERIDTGNLRISGNTIESLSGDINFSSASDTINLQNDVAITGDLDVTGDVTIGGNITIGDEASDSLNIIAGINSDLIPAQTSTYSLGSDTNTWSNIYVDDAEIDDIRITDNYITTTASNADLDLRANGTGEILVPENNVQIDNDLNVDGTTTLGDTNIVGTLTHVGDYNQTGDTTVTGNVNVSQDLDVSGAAQFEEILVDDNYITTTTSNADLELRANGTGNIIVPNNDVTFSQNLDVGETISVRNITATGTVSVNDYTVSDIHIDDNYIETTVSNADLELRANGTGRVYIPSNDVQIDNNLDVTGNVTVGNDLTIGGDFSADDITITGTATANEFTTGDIRIFQNVITTSTSNSNLNLRANGTGNVVAESFEFDDNTIRTTNDLILEPGSEYIKINSTGALRIPVGTEAERPTAEAGQIRFNSDTNVFEGYDGTNWIQLHGVIDLDRDTSVTAELTPGANDNTIRFNVAGAVVADITSSRLNSNQVVVDDITINGNVISSSTDTDLELTANGTGSVLVENFSIKDNSITNNVQDAVTVFENTNDGYVKFDGTYGMVIPVGGNANRPPIAFTEIGQMRWNTDAARTEIWDGSNWVSVAGTSSGISRREAEDLALEIVLALG